MKITKTLIVVILTAFFGLLLTGQTPIAVSGIGFPVLAPDGTALTPSFTFANNVGTGIYNIGGALGISVVGFNQGSINGSGWNVTKINYASTPCVSSASPAVCGGNSAGSVVVAAAATTIQVNTTSVTANSMILLTFDSSLGARLSVTCNTTVPTVYSVSARTAASNFTITATAPTTNPACFTYVILN